MLNEDNYRSRKRIKQSRFGSNVSGCLVIFFVSERKKEMFCWNEN